MKIKIASLLLAAVFTSAIAVADASIKRPMMEEPARKLVDQTQSPSNSGTAIPSSRAAAQPGASTEGKFAPTTARSAKSSGEQVQPPIQVPPWPFYITIFVIVTAGLVNYALNVRTMGNQTNEATRGRQADHQNKISEYRHAWLQDLRDTASELVKAIYQAQSALMRSNLSRGYRDSPAHQNDVVAAGKHQEAVLAAAAEERVAVAEMRKYVAKIKLLFKPNDAQAAQLFLLLAEIIGATNDSKVVSIDDTVVNDIVAEIQVILKAEWETTKKRMAHLPPK
jgi:hypothetical protein